MNQYSSAPSQREQGDIRMKRRKFVKVVGAGGGAVLAGITPAAMTDTRALETATAKTSESAPAPRHSLLRTPPATCRLKQYHGKPTVFVNAKPCFPLAYLSYFPKQFRYKNMRETGMRFFSLSISLGDRWVGAYKNGKVRLDRKGIWDAPAVIDFATFDTCINEILQVAPDAFIFPRIFCDSPSWWDSYHPAEVNRTYKDGLPMRQSFSSLVWREETAEVLRKIVRHVLQSTYADRFIGIHVAAGETEESVHHMWLGPGDYSIAAQNKFRQWLLGRYGKDGDLITRQFRRSIDQIVIPSPEERVKPDVGDFFDPERSRLAVDYRLFRCEELVESFDFLCNAVKDESGGNLLTGIFYGYTFEQWLDHMALSRMLKSPHIDFVSSTIWHTEIDSIIKAGKVFYNEGDERTCLGKWISETRPEIDPYHEYDQEGWLRHEPMEASLEHLKSEFSHAVCTNSIIWWFDLWGGWYDHERILNLFGEMQKVADESLQLPRRSVSQVCVIVDERSFLYFSRLRRGWVGDIPWIRDQKEEIDRFGAPYDIFLMEDLGTLDCSNYRMVIFFNSVVLTEHDKEMISQKVMNQNRTLLWLYAPGLIGDRISIDNVSSFLKMEIDYEESRTESDVFTNLHDRKLTSKGSSVAPFVYVKSGSGKVYGHTNDGHAILAEKKEMTFTNVIGSLPPVQWEVIRFLAAEAGVHIYDDEGDYVLATESYLSIRASHPGKRSVRLPAKCALLEVLDSDNEFKTEPRGVRKAADKFEMDFPETGRVRFFQVIKGTGP